MTLAHRLAYTLGQGAKFSWYYSQYRLAQRFTDTAVRRDEVPEGLPDRQRLLRGLFALFRRDLANIEHGYYSLPHDLVVRPDALLRTSRRFFNDLSAVNVRRRLRRRGRNVSTSLDVDAGTYPRYYRQAFHDQTDGYLSDRSAALYDYQVEVLFTGGADVMRRQALVPLYHFLNARPAGPTRLVDVGCGTGRFLSFVKANHGAVEAVGFDLSPHYLRQARRTLRPWVDVRLGQGQAEALPLADACVDVVACTFLFHELPRAIRARAVAEMARVLRPGGRVLFVETVQRGDVPDFDGLLSLFPLAYHEPYYADYVSTDVAEQFTAAGFVLASTDIAFLSKVSVFDKPA